ncbi:rap guanine nucleotide exchange factor 5-like [Engraulis encrasicolus]|uniref:rap guanine nucleotide exchange factor 5-like n=1 Tax=Engraulis encrasicolus TaxID=184585 RepID=UPI002FD59CAC
MGSQTKQQQWRQPLDFYLNTKVMAAALDDDCPGDSSVSCRRYGSAWSAAAAAPHRALGHLLDHMRLDDHPSSTSSRDSEILLQDFLLTYMLFMSTKDLCQALLRNYSSKRGVVCEETSGALLRKRKVLHIVSRWASLYKDFLRRDNDFITLFMKSLHRCVLDDLCNYPSLETELRTLQSFLSIQHCISGMTVEVRAPFTLEPEMPGEKEVSNDMDLPLRYFITKRKGCIARYQPINPRKNRMPLLVVERGQLRMASTLSTVAQVADVGLCQLTLARDDHQARLVTAIEEVLQMAQVVFPGGAVDHHVVNIAPPQHLVLLKWGHLWSVLVMWFLFISVLFITVDITVGSSFCHLASVGLDVVRLHFCWSLAPKTAATKLLYCIYVCEDSYVSVKAKSSARAEALLSVLADRLDIPQEDIVIAAVSRSGEKLLLQPQDRVFPNCVFSVERLQVYRRDLTTVLTLLSDSALQQQRTAHLLSLNAWDVAVTLTNFDWSLFECVQEPELICFTCSRDTCVGHTGALERMLQRCSEVQLWVMTELLLCSALCKRVQLLKKFIKVAAHCKAQRNMSSFFAIIMGLNTAAVSRLSQTWEKVSWKFRKVFSELESLTDPSFNHKTYRTTFSQMKSPKIPFLPLLLKDITFVREGNKTFLDNLLNFDKLHMMAESARLIKHCKLDPMGDGGRQKDDPDTSCCIRHLHIISSQETLFDLSHRLEPRT